MGQLRKCGSRELGEQRSVDRLRCLQHVYAEEPFVEDAEQSHERRAFGPTTPYRHNATLCRYQLLVDHTASVWIVQLGDLVRVARDRYIRAVPKVALGDRRSLRIGCGEDG